jgi:small conductance mechanosensitive channel
MTDSIDSIQNQFFASPTLANLAIKLFFVVVVLVVMKILLNLAIRALNLFSNRNFPHISSSKKTTVFSVVESLIKFTIAFIGVTVILNLFGINTSSIIATAGIGGIAIAFGAQNLIRDVLSGAFFLLEDQFNVGDFLTIGSLSGTVEVIGLRTMTLRDYSGALHILPNSSVQQISNYSKNPIKADVKIPVPYQTPQTEVLEIIEKVADACMAETDYFTIRPAFLGVDSLNDWTYTVQITAETISGRHVEGQRLLRAKMLNEFQSRGIGTVDWAAIAADAKKE